MIENIFKDLDFISGIKKGEKPCFSDKTCISTSEWFPTLKRRWKNEIGEKGVIYVDTLLNSISSYVKTFSSLFPPSSEGQDILSQDKEVKKIELEKLREKLVNSLVGLHNLVYTYKIENQITVSDDYFKSTEKVESLILQIDESIKSVFLSSQNNSSSNNTTNVNKKLPTIPTNFFKFSSPSVIKN